MNLNLFVRIQYWLEVYGALQIEEFKNAEREHWVRENDKYDKNIYITTTTTPTTLQWRQQKKQIERKCEEKESKIMTETLESVVQRTTA